MKKSIWLFLFYDALMGYSRQTVSKKMCNLLYRWLDAPICRLDVKPKRTFTYSGWIEYTLFREESQDAELVETGSLYEKCPFASGSQQGYSGDSEIFFKTRYRF